MASITRDRSGRVTSASKDVLKKIPNIVGQRVSDRQAENITGSLSGKVTKEQAEERIRSDSARARHNVNLQKKVESGQPLKAGDIIQKGTILPMTTANKRAVVNTINASNSRRQQLAAQDARYAAREQAGVPTVVRQGKEEQYLNTNRNLQSDNGYTQQARSSDRVNNNSSLLGLDNSQARNKVDSPVISQATKKSKFQRFDSWLGKVQKDSYEQNRNPNTSNIVFGKNILKGSAAFVGGVGVTLVNNIIVAPATAIMHPVQTAKGLWGLKEKENRDYLFTSIQTEGQNRPDKVLGNIISIEAVPRANNFIGTSIKNTYVAAGSKYVAPETVYAPEVLSGKSNFPLAKDTTQALEQFNKPNAAGEIKVINSAPMKLAGTKVTIPPGTRQAVGLEDTGIYVTPTGRASPRFLGVMQDAEYELSLLPNVKGMFSVPTSTTFKVRGVTTYTDDVLKVPGFEATSEFQLANADTGYAFITKRSMIGKGELPSQLYPARERIRVGNKVYNPGDLMPEQGTPEIEAVIPIGSSFKYRPTTTAGKIKGFDTYTKINGRNVAIRDAELSGSSDIPIGNYKTITGKHIASESSYLASSSKKRITVGLPVASSVGRSMYSERDTPLAKGDFPEPQPMNDKVVSRLQSKYGKDFNPNGAYVDGNIYLSDPEVYPHEVGHLIDFSVSDRKGSELSVISKQKYERLAVDYGVASPKLITSNYPKKYRQNEYDAELIGAYLKGWKGIEQSYPKEYGRAKWATESYLKSSSRRTSSASSAGFASSVPKSSSRRGSGRSSRPVVSSPISSVSSSKSSTSRVSVSRPKVSSSVVSYRGGSSYGRLNTRYNRAPITLYKSNKTNNKRLLKPSKPLSTKLSFKSKYVASVEAGLFNVKGKKKFNEKTGLGIRGL